MLLYYFLGGLLLLSKEDLGISCYGALGAPKFGQSFIRPGLD